MPALSVTVGRSPPMPRIQTLTVAASLASRKSAVRSSNGPAPAVSRAPAGNPAARRAAPRTSVMPAATCSLSPTRARSTASCAAHHRIEHEPHGLTAQARRVERERVPARRRPQIAQRVGGTVGVEGRDVHERRADRSARADQHDLLGAPDRERRRLERRVVAQRRVVAARAAGAHRDGAGPEQRPAGQARAEARGDGPRGRRALHEQACVRRPPGGIGRDRGRRGARRDGRLRAAPAATQHRDDGARVRQAAGCHGGHGRARLARRPRRAGRPASQERYGPKLRLPGSRRRPDLA